MPMPSQSRFRRIVSLSVPIFGSQASGALLTLVDSAFVGSLGFQQLAAVGLAGMAAWIYLGFFQAFNIAVQATVARRVGEADLLSLQTGQSRDLARVGLSLNAALLILALSAPLSAALLWWLTPALLNLLTSDSAVLAHGTPYLRWLVAQSFFYGLISAYSGFWNGVSRSHLYLPILITMHITNALLAWTLIFGKLGLPALGTAGAGLATFCATCIGAVIYSIVTWRQGRAYGFLSAWPLDADIRSLLRLSFPVGIQQLLDSLALTLMFRIVGLIGTVELAAYSVLINFIGLVGMPAFAFGTAGATLVSESIGRKDIDGAAHWARDVMRYGFVLLTLIGVPFWLLPDAMLSIYLSDPVALEAGRWPMRILGVMIAVNGFGYMLSAMLNGAGDVRRVTWTNLLTQWLWLLPGAWLLGPYLGLGLMGAWGMHQFGFRALQSLIYWRMWRQRSWARIAI